MSSVSFGGGYVKPWRRGKTILLLVVLVRNQTKQGRLECLQCGPFPLPKQRREMPSVLECEI